MNYNRIILSVIVGGWVGGWSGLGLSISGARAQGNQPAAPTAQRTAPASNKDDDDDDQAASPAPKAPISPRPAVTPAPVAVPPNPAPGAALGGSGKMIDTIDFPGTPVPAVLEYYAKLTGRSIISSPTLGGAITFRSQTPLTLEEAIEALDSVLAINGIAVIPMGDKFLKVVQINTAMGEGVAVSAKEKPGLPPADKLITQIIALKFGDAAEMAATLQPYKHPYGQVIPLAKSNSLLITDTAATINQMLEILAYVDQPSPMRMQTKVYVIQRAKAAEVVQRLQDVIQQTQAIGAGATVTPRPINIPGRPMIPHPTVAGSSEETVVEGKVILTADERTNKIFILSRESNFAFFDQMIAELDAKVEPDVITKVIPLNYANADDIAGILNSFISGGAAPARRTTSTGPGTTRSTSSVPPPPVSPIGGVGGGGTQPTGFLQFSEGVRVLADVRTSSLLIMATKQDMERLEDLVRRIDTSVAQVLVEVVIGEVTLNNELDVGVNLMKRLEQNAQVRSMGGTTTDAKLPTPPPDLSGLPVGAGLSMLPQGAALSSALTYFATFKNLRLDAAIRLLSSTSNFRVLSTPIIQALNNQEADILVGESRPIITATLSGVTTVTSSNQAAGSFQSNVEYKDIAIELKVTPRINPDGYVTMDIDQKVNDIGGSVNISGNDQPIITKREAKSSVTVKDQNMIVLGGLIKEQKGVSESKVPFLGDIPFLGHLFKTKSNTKVRTELIVFIRPTVLRTQAEASNEAHRRADALQSGKELELDKLMNHPVPGSPDDPLPAKEPEAKSTGKTAD